MWKDNCLALGLSSGFIEPLESTSIHLIARGVEFFLRYFPDADCDPALIREYNRRMRADYEEIRDFIQLHYCATQRTDSDFWKHCCQLPIPDSLQQRIDLFKARGYCVINWTRSLKPAAGRRFSKAWAFAPDARRRKPTALVWPLCIRRWTKPAQRSIRSSTCNRATKSTYNP